MQLINRHLNAKELQSYFDIFVKRFLRDTTRDEVDVEALHADIGDQHEVTGVRLDGITYDPDTAELDVMFENGEHHIYSTQSLWVAEEPDGFIAAIQVKRSDEITEIIRMRRKPLPALPRAEAGGGRDSVARSAVGSETARSTER
jgi:hypothetical protein